MAASGGNVERRFVAVRPEAGSPFSSPRAVIENAANGLSEAGELDSVNQVFSAQRSQGADWDMIFGMDSALADEHRSAFPDLFKLADVCEETALSASASTFKGGGKGAILASIYCRCLSHFRAAIILAEQGQAIESMVITRSLYETTFVFRALASDVITLDEVGASDLAHRTKISRRLVPHAEKHGSPLIDDLQSFIEENKDSKALKFEKLARDSGLGEAYDGIYSHLSHYAAHPSVTALAEYIVETPEGKFKVAYRLPAKQLPKALLLACGGILLACSIWEQVVGLTPVINNGIKACQDQYQLLYDKHEPLFV